MINDDWKRLNCTALPKPKSTVLLKLATADSPVFTYVIRWHVFDCLKSLCVMCGCTFSIYLTWERSTAFLWACDSIIHSIELAELVTFALWIECWTAHSLNEELILVLDCLLFRRAGKNITEPSLCVCIHPWQERSNRKLNKYTGLQLSHEVTRRSLHDLPFVLLSHSLSFHDTH